MFNNCRGNCAAEDLTGEIIDAHQTAAHAQTSLVKIYLRGEWWIRGGVRGMISGVCGGRLALDTPLEPRMYT